MSVVRVLCGARDGALAQGAQDRVFPMRIAMDHKKPLFFQGKTRARRMSCPSTGAARRGTYVASPLTTPSGWLTLVVTCGDAHHAKRDVNGLQNFPKFVG
jgi:hypothetical protein